MMKIQTISLIAALAALSAIPSASAGTLTVSSGPTFTPPAAFTNNSIRADRLQNPPGVAGDVIRLSGGATVTPGGASSVSITFSGNYSANSGDLASVAYSFTIDSNVDGPVTYQLTGSATVPFFGNQNFSSSGTVVRGLNQYRGKFKAPSAFPAATTGTFTGTLRLNFGTSGAAMMNALPDATAGTLDMKIEQFDFQLAPTEASPLLTSQPRNISTRLAVQTEQNVLIGGFIITGEQTKRVIVRGIGPSLGFAGTLANPTLELYGVEATLGINDDWKQNQAEVEATTLAPTNDLESAIVADLEPGSYTAILRGKDATTGIGLVEVYDLSPTGTGTKLANISTRGFVQTGNDVMIAGFILGPDNTASSRVVVRAIGPSLSGQGVNNPLQNPVLELRDLNGTLLATNDDWQQSPESETIVQVGLAPSDTRESALLVIPPPGSYTAIVKGVDNTTGVGLVEAYHLQ